jgi:4-hydroxy-3-methylbut-2-enyl diphosphate reductase
MQIRLANPRGFCAGVDRAIEIVNRALEVFGAPIYVRHEVVHNKFVVEDLRARGAVFVDELDEVPDDTIVIFSAHGVSQAVQHEAARRGLRVFDATCPLVTKVHMEVMRYSRQGRECILIGHAGHPEVEGTMGQYDSANGGAIYLIENLEQVASLAVRDPSALSYVTQTTLSVDDTASIIDALRTRHLLRHPEPPGCGEATGARMRSGARGGFAEQLQLEPPCRACATHRCERASHRLR